MVNSAGIISTVAGNGLQGSNGDGGPATNAQLSQAYGVVADNSGNIYIGDQGNHNIRLVNSAGIITTYAGTGIAGSSGDGGFATNAQLYNPFEVALDNSGNLYIADVTGQAIRVVKRVCPAGAYMSGSNCLLCAASTYNPSIGATACTTCPASYVSQSGASQCSTASPSPPPSYAPGSSASVTVQCVQVLIYHYLIRLLHKLLSFT